MKQNRLRVGVVGLRFMGEQFTEAILARDHEVVGADASEEARARFEKQFQVETYAKPEDLFAENIDAMVVATPNRLHERNVLAAFEQGLDVLVNKPLAHSLESAERIAEAASQTDAICMVGFHNQFRDLVRELRSLLADDHFGKITHVQANHVRRRGIPRKGSWMTSQEFAGGGALMDIGVHVIQLLFTLFGTTDIREIMATTRREWGNRDDYSYLHMYGGEEMFDVFDVEDSVSAFLRFERDRTASIEAAWAASNESRHEYRIRGTEAGAHLEITDSAYGDRCRLRVFEPNQTRREYFQDTEYTAYEDRSINEMVASFLQTVQMDRTLDVNDVDEGLAVQRVVDAIYRADEEQRAVYPE